MKGYLQQQFFQALGAPPPKPKFFTQQNICFVEPELVMLDYKRHAPAKEFSFSIDHGIHGAQLHIDTAYLATDIIQKFRRHWTKRRKDLRLEQRAERELTGSPGSASRTQTEGKNLSKKIKREQNPADQEEIEFLTASERTEGSEGSLGNDIDWRSEWKHGTDDAPWNLTVRSEEQEQEHQDSQLDADVVDAMRGYEDAIKTLRDEEGEIDKESDDSDPVTWCDEEEIENKIQHETKKLEDDSEEEEANEQVREGAEDTDILADLTYSSRSPRSRQGSKGDLQHKSPRSAKRTTALKSPKIKETGGLPYSLRISEVSEAGDQNQAEEWDDDEDEEDEDMTNGTMVFNNSNFSPRSCRHEPDDDATSSGVDELSEDYSESEEDNAGEGMSKAGTYKLEEEMTAKYLEWQRQKQMYEDEVNGLWTKKSQLDQMKQQCQRDMHTVSEQLKKLDEEKSRQPAKLAALMKANDELDTELAEKRKQLHDIGHGFLPSSPRKGMTTRGFPGSMGEDDMEEAIAGLSGDSHQVCCVFPCSCCCGYELSCMRPREEGSRRAEFELDEMDHVPPGQMA